MHGAWIVSLVAVLALAQLRSSHAEVCPNLQPNNRCYFTNVAKLQPAGAQYYAVGGLFNVHKRGESAYKCSSEFNPSEVMLSQAFLWSLQYWQNKITGSQVSVGAVVFDSCDSTAQMTQNLLGFEQCNLRIEGIDRHNLVGFVGTSNSEAEAAATLTSDMDLTLISPQADSVLLSNHGKYPYFLRTVPSMQMDVRVMGQVLKHVQTEYVVAVYEQSEMATFQAFNMTMKDSKICITASLALTEDQVDTFFNSNLQALVKTRFVALFLSPELTMKLMRKAADSVNVRTKSLVYLLASNIRRDSPLYNGSYSVAIEDALSLAQSQQSGMEAAVNDFKQYWSQLIQGTRPTNSRINNPFLSEYLNKTTVAQIPRDHWALANTIMATKAFVDGMQRAGSDICSTPVNYLCSSFFDIKGRGSDLNQKIRSSTNYFTPVGTNGKFINGDLRSSMVDYQVSRFQLQGTFQQVGMYSKDNLTFTVPIKGMASYRPGQCLDSLCLQCGELPPTTTTTTTTTTGSLAEKCEPERAGNFSIVYYPPDQEITGAYMPSIRMDSEYATRFEVGQRWIIALGALAGLGILAVMVFEVYILYKLLGTRMGHKWRTMWLGQLLLFGILLCYLTLFAYLPIPTNATCGITRFGVGVSYSICFAVLLVKLMVILTSKTSESSLLPGDMESPNYLKGVYQFLMFVFVVGVQVVIDAQWLITVPPEAIKVTSNGGQEVWVCNHYTFRASGSMSAMTDMSAFVRNEFENHVLSLVYIMFLILITTVLALNAHGIITNHRESVFIGIAAGFSIPIWLAWALVGGLNKDHNYAHEFSDACIAFGLFLTATLILFSMFLPKVRQLVSMGVEGIYFEDDRDTVYAGSVIMAPPSYKSRPNSVIYVNNQGIYSEPMVLGNGDSSNYLRHPGSRHPTPASTYSAPPMFSKKGDSSVRGGSVLRVTDDLSGRRPLEKRRPVSEYAYGTASRPPSHRGTLPRSRSHTSLGAL